MGPFKTAPKGSDRGSRFAVTGDADGALNPATGQPAYNFFESTAGWRASATTST